MKSMQCPKCKSKEIVRIPGDIQPPSILSGAKPPSSFRVIRVTRFCCAACGYTELWVDDPADLKDLMKRFGF